MNTSTEVAEYSHRSVETIWRRTKPFCSLPRALTATSPLPSQIRFWAEKRSSKFRQTDPGSWVNLPTTFASLVSVLALGFSPWKSTLGLPLFTPFLVPNQSTFFSLGVRCRREMREMKDVLSCLHLNFKCILYTFMNFKWISLAFTFNLNLKSQTIKANTMHIMSITIHINFIKVTCCQVTSLKVTSDLTLDATDWFDAWCDLRRRTQIRNTNALAITLGLGFANSKLMIFPSRCN